MIKEKFNKILYFIMKMCKKKDNKSVKTIENSIRENEEFVRISKSAFTKKLLEFTDALHNYTDTLHNYNIRNQLLSYSKKLVDEYITEQKIKLNTEKKKYLTKIKKLHDPRDKEEFEKDYLNTEYTTKLKIIDDMQEKMCKEFEEAINNKYKVDEQLLAIENAKELLTKLNYRKDKYYREIMEILDRCSSLRY